MYFHNNKTPNIIIFGDIMLDHNIYGNIEKLANEAPIPVLHKKEENKGEAERNVWQPKFIDEVA